MKIGFYLAVLFAMLSLSGCAPHGNSASTRANQQANQNLYQAKSYQNSHVQGPAVVVLPGEIKSSNATFVQRVSANNIADFGELELSNANFRVLERSDLGGLLNEFEIAYKMGDPSTARRLLQRGKFKSTRFIVRFDILKAEPAASAANAFDARVIGNIIGGDAGRVVSSIKTDEFAKVWIIGLRYKVINAQTTEQMGQGYFEKKMELGGQGVSILGLSQSGTQSVGLDTLVQRLVQEAVYDIDRKYKPRNSTPSYSSQSNTPAYDVRNSNVRVGQQILADLGYPVGRPDGVIGRNTRRAISMFQQDYGLAVTGEFDSATMDKLQRLAP